MILHQLHLSNPTESTLTSCCKPLYFLYRNYTFRISINMVTNTQVFHFCYTQPICTYFCINKICLNHVLLWLYIYSYFPMYPPLIVITGGLTPSTLNTIIISAWWPTQITWLEPVFTLTTSPQVYSLARSGTRNISQVCIYCINSMSDILIAYLVTYW